MRSLNLSIPPTTYLNINTIPQRIHLHRKNQKRERDPPRKREKKKTFLLAKKTKRDKENSASLLRRAEPYKQTPPRSLTKAVPQSTSLPLALLLGHRVPQKAPNVQVFFSSIGNQGGEYSLFKYNFPTIPLIFPRGSLSLSLLRAFFCRFWGRPLSLSLSLSCPTKMLIYRIERLVMKKINPTRQSPKDLET